MKGKSRIGFQSVVILLLVLVIVLLALLLLKNLSPAAAPPAQSVSEEQRSGGRIGYATTGVTIATDENTLQQAVDEMNASANDGIGVEYRVGAYSEDGVNFSCYIGNPADSPRDKFISIYADGSLSEELFVSGLLRPGEAFESISLNRKLEQGSHQLYVAFTDVVDDENGDQEIFGQTFMVITFNVL